MPHVTEQGRTYWHTPTTAQRPCPTRVEPPLVALAVAVVRAMDIRLELVRLPDGAKGYVERKR